MSKLYDFPNNYVLYLSYALFSVLVNISIYKYLIFIDIYMKEIEYAHFQNNIVYLIHNSDIDNVKNFNNLQYYINKDHSGIRLDTNNFNQYLTVVKARDDNFKPCNITKYLKCISIYCSCDSDDSYILYVYNIVLRYELGFRSIEEKTSNLPYILKMYICHSDDSYTFYE